MTEHISDPADPDLTVGQRVKYYRQARGMSQNILGELIGRNGRWVRALENGELGEPKLSTILQIAEALRIRDVAKLAGEPIPIAALKGPGHPKLSAVRDAINSVAVPTTDGAPPPLLHLRLRLDAAWRARHSSPDHRTVLGGLLPGLILDARRAARAYEGADRRQALAILAGVYNLAQFFVAYQPDSGLLWRIVERSLLTAQESEDPRAFGGAVWLAAQAHRDDGNLEAAETVNREALEALAPHMDDADDRLRAMWGALHHEVAYTAAKMGQTGAAWRWFERADRIANELPAEYYDPMTSFGQAIMGAHSVTVAVELRHAGEARQQAQQNAAAAIPSNPRRGRHLIEVARAWRIAGDQAEALGTLQDAQRAAPETVRYNGYARRMIAEAAKEGEVSLRRDARALAGQVGILV